MKTCKSCKKLKPLVEYHPDKSGRDGHRSMCKECTNARLAAKRAKWQTEGFKQITEKQCNRCNEIKTIDNFFREAASSDGYYSICKTCKKISVYQWRDSHRDAYNAKAREWGQKNQSKRYGHEIKRRYGCTLEQYNQMLIDQNGKCAICERLHNPAVKKGRLYVDHCHTRGGIRQLLCGDCNSGLGYFKDQPELLLKAIEYLKKHST